MVTARNVGNKETARPKAPGLPSLKPDTRNQKPETRNQNPETRNQKLALLVALVLVAGCDVFAPRTPEDPVSEAGTFVQPDAPDLVVDNLQAAIAEMNTANYRRSLAEDLTFKPTADAEAREPSLWSSWGKTEEVSTFSTLAEAARLNTGHELRLLDASADVGDTRYTLDATYLLIVHHRRPDAPDTVQGRLVWEIEQGDDGLWALRGWTDQDLGSSPSWSDLKAAFGQ